MPNYGDATYWDDRYTQQKQTTFDWLESWSDVKESIERNAVNGCYQDQCLVNKDQLVAIRNATKTLNLGCGNSVMCEDMYDDGYLHISNMDISSVCIDQMKGRNSQRRPEMDWEVMDVRDLKYPNETFDLIVDKSTIDALLCGNYAYFNVAVMMKEC